MPQNPLGTRDYLFIGRLFADLRFRGGPEVEGPEVGGPEVDLRLVDLRLVDLRFLGGPEVSWWT